MSGIFQDAVFGGLFGDPEAMALWSAEAQLERFRTVEAALSKALAEVGLVAQDQGPRAAAYISTAPIDRDRLAEGCAKDGLPIPNFVAQLKENAADLAGAIHTGSTSQDIMDTALSLTIRATNDLLLARLGSVTDALADLDRRFGTAPMMGRTRMQVALPITVGDRIKSWRDPLLAQAASLIALRPQIERLQFGGAVGTRHAYGDRGGAMAETMARELGLTNGPVWQTDRSSLVMFANQLSVVSGILGKIGQDISLMTQQGIDEIALSGGGGSSAMPHKSNPILAELLVTLARYNASQMSAMHHSLIHEQERSGAAWALEWMVLPAMAVATARALKAAADLCAKVTQMGQRE